jgi:hypothetical protein
MTPREYKKQQLQKIADKKIKPYQKISNTFIANVISNSNASAIKTVYYLSSILEPIVLEKHTDTQLISITIDLKQMLQYTDISLNEIKRNIKQMQETSITFVDEGAKTVEGMALLPRYHVIAGKNKIEIDLYFRIAKMIVDVKKNYTFINTQTLMNLKNKHSLRLLPVLNRLNQYTDKVAKRKRFELDELNDLFGTNYKNFYDMQRKIIEPVKTELDLNSKLSFVFELNFENLYKGRPKATNIIIDVIDNSGSLFAL